MDILGELQSFYNSFDGEKGSIGKTVKNKDIYYFCVRKTAHPVVLIQYAIHAREYITCYLALKQIQDFIISGNRGTVYFIPALNVDGIEICLDGNPLYKANARGVDLNVNFDACWGTGIYNTRKRGGENCIGDFPFSEPETVALKDLP